MTSLLTSQLAPRIIALIVFNEAGAERSPSGSNMDFRNISPHLQYLLHENKIHRFDC